MGNTITQTHLPSESPLGKKRSREDVLYSLKQNTLIYESFVRLHDDEFQEELIRYFMGVGGIQVTYDSVFKHTFNPKRHPERLSRLLTQLIGEEVTVQSVLPITSDRLSEKGSLLIMDILVELTTGELANVEIQRIGYNFPGPRGACYSSDLVLRQYSDTRDREGKSFSYRHLHSVYTIVLIGDSPKEFSKYPNQYIHRSRQTFDTGLQLELLQKYIFISLDNFGEISQNKGIETELEAWLHFLIATDITTMCNIINVYPWFKEIYEDLARFRNQPEEMIRMYSDALKTLDYNTVQYMIEEQKKTMKQQDATIEQKDAALEQKDAALEQKDAALEQKDAALEQKDAALEQKDAALEQKDAAIEQLLLEIERLKQLT